MLGNLKIDGQRSGMWWDTAWGGAGATPPPFLDTGELLAWYKGGTADGLTLIDKIDPSVYTTTLIGTNCVGFDGTTGNGIEIPVALNFGADDYSGKISFTIDLEQSVLQYLFDGRDSSGDGFRILYAGTQSVGEVWLSHNADHLKIIGLPLADGAVHTIEWSKVGTTLSAIVDGVPYGTTVEVTGSIDVTNFARICGEASGTHIYPLYGSVGFCSVDGYFTLPLSEEEGATNYDASGNGNHGTLVGGTWSAVDGYPSWNHSKGFTRVSSLYKVTEPADGWEVNRTFDPTNDDTAKLMDSLSTVGYDQSGDPDGIAYTVTPITWLRTFDPNGSTLDDFFDVLGTLMQDIEDGVVNAWTLSEPIGGRVRVYDPNTDNLNQAYDFMGTLLLDLRDAGLIG